MGQVVPCLETKLQEERLKWKIQPSTSGDFINPTLPLPSPQLPLPPLNPQLQLAIFEAKQPQNATVSNLPQNSYLKPTCRLLSNVNTFYLKHWSNSQILSLQSFHIRNQETRRQSPWQTCPRHRVTFLRIKRKWVQRTEKLQGLFPLPP